MAQRRTVYFSGEVQGVGFRATAEQIAATRSVTGYVRNLPDRRVELVAEGPASEIDRLLSEIRDHFGLMIDEVHSTTSPTTGEFPDFCIRR